MTLATPVPQGETTPAIHFNETLYKVHSGGKIGSWQITVTHNAVDNTANMLIASRKVLGGKAVETPTKYTVGKNIGRSNETSPLEQAVYEAQSKVKKQLDKGYVTEMPEEGAAVTNSLGFVKPMLAQPIEKVKDWDYPVWVQPKFDGHRLLATVQDGKVVLYSRGGKLIELPHIKEKLQACFDEAIWDGTTLDGEVYYHGFDLQKVSSLVKKPTPESCNLDYYIYDCVSGGSYDVRLAKVRKIISASKKVYGANCLILTITVCVDRDSEHSINSLHACHIANGYEGTIVRHSLAPYEDGKRSKSLMKKKDFQDAEFVITGLEQGKRNERLDLDVGVYVCQTEDGKTFTVTAPGTAEEKDHHAKTGKNNIGRHMTVKFFNYTPDGVPFLPVALRIREDI